MAFLRHSFYYVLYENSKSIENIHDIEIVEKLDDNSIIIRTVHDNIENSMQKFGKIIKIEKLKKDNRCIIVNSLDDLKLDDTYEYVKYENILIVNGLYEKMNNKKYISKFLQIEDDDIIECEWNNSGEKQENEGYDITFIITIVKNLVYYYSSSILFFMLKSMLKLYLR